MKKIAIFDYIGLSRKLYKIGHYYGMQLGKLYENFRMVSFSMTLSEL